MVIYVAHKYGGDPENYERAKRITHDLQIKDTQNTYICPLMAFSELDYNEMGYAEEIAMCDDLLTVCDVLLVASEQSPGVIHEIDLANKIHMEVRYLHE